MTPNTALFEVEESASPRLFARVLQPTLGTREAADPLRFPGTDEGVESAPEAFEETPIAPSPYKAPSSGSSTTGALRVSPQALSDSHIHHPDSAAQYNAEHPIWDSEPAYPSHHYGAQSVAQHSVMFTISARATASASLLLKVLRAITVPLVIACAALVATGSTQATMLPVIGMIIVSIAASATLALAERTRFTRDA